MLWCMKGKRGEGGRGEGKKKGGGEMESIGKEGGTALPRRSTAPVPRTRRPGRPSAGSGRAGGESRGLRSRSEGQLDVDEGLASRAVVPVVGLVAGKTREPWPLDGERACQSGCDCLGLWQWECNGK